MSEAVSDLSEREIAELCALADGTLPPDRVAAVKARVAASPELQEVVERQRLAVAATHALSEEQPAASLVEAVEGLRPRRGTRRSRWLMPRVAIAGGLAVLAAVVVAVVLTGGPGAPTVADAASFASKPSNLPPPPAASATRLALAVEGVVFPNFERWAGWHALGVRRGHVDGRDATVVFYGKSGKRIAYVIVAGSGLPRPTGAQTTIRNGVEYQTLQLNGRPAVTWRRGGRTCVLLGQATRGELVGLASWPLRLPG